MTVILMSPSQLEAAAQAEENVALFNRLVPRWRPSKKTKTTPKPASDGPKDTIVAVRVRPRLQQEVDNEEPTAAIPRFGQSQTIDTHNLTLAGVNRPATLKTTSFNADQVYDADTTSEDIYEDIVKPLIPWVCGGGTATLFAHGQTGSGKTHTISSIQKLVSEGIFADAPPGRRVKASFVELAGNAAYDLINSSKPVGIRQDDKGNIQLCGLLEVAVKNHEALSNYMEIASALRRTSSTVKNSASSRSHAICRIQIEEMHSTEAGELFLIDLAGSEAARSSMHDGNQLNETREINSSLSVLNSCIKLKAEADANPKKKVRVPFRESSLTKVLKVMFDPESVRGCKIVMLACVSPCLGDISPTRNTLRYAETCRTMVTKKKIQKYNPKIPLTWNSVHVKTWLKENSGTPAVDPNIVAPYESGQQILSVSIQDFVARCVQTPGVSSEQAAAVWSKLWQLHVDSKKGGSSNDDGLAPGKSSQEPDQAVRNLVHFKQRLRPGMAVQCEAPDGPARQSGTNMAVILSDVAAVPRSTRDFFGNPVHPEGKSIAEGTQYLCAMVTSGSAMVNSGYDVHLWRQVVVSVSAMMHEITLVYDEHARHYFLHV